MEVFLAIAVAAVAIATLIVVISFGKRTEKQVSAILGRSRDTSVTNNETAINELRARLDQLTASLQAVQEFLWPLQAPVREAASPADGSSPDPEGDDQV